VSNGGRQFVPGSVNFPQNFPVKSSHHRRFSRNRQNAVRL
jgi:hypothetical protein